MLPWSRAGVLLSTLILASCSGGATMLQEQDASGVVVYPFKDEQGHMLSSFRRDALSLIQKKCGNAYTITREGETKSRSRVAGTVQGGQEMVQERRWAIEFRCK